MKLQHPISLVALAAVPSKDIKEICAGTLHTCWGLEKFEMRLMCQHQSLELRFRPQKVSCIPPPVMEHILFVHPQQIQGAVERDDSLTCLGLI